MAIDTKKSGSGFAARATNNPYHNFYKDTFGYVFGRPCSYLPKTDPNHRVFQSTMLRHNTIINVVPGRPFVDENMLDTAKEKFTKYNEAYEKKKAGRASDAELDKLTNDFLAELQREKIDLRFASFRQNTAEFLTAMQGITSRVGTALFTGTGVTFNVDALTSQISEDAANRGFKIWVEKGTSISEAVDNSFGRSLLENAQREMSNLVRQLKFLGVAVGVSADTATTEGQTTEVTSSNSMIEATGNMASMASRTAGGAVFDFPQIFEQSQFNRSYDISFRFVSPYGDDRSIYHHVLVPFLFLLTCSLPRQDGPSGHQSPFLLQLDAPGYFSCPMGVVTSFSFKKGGDDMLFNDRGLPLIIEGSMSIMDLYSNLSLPLNHRQFATNFGASSFFGGLGGLPLYAAHDPALADRIENYLKGLVQKPLYGIAYAKQTYYSLMRVLGVGEANR